MKKIGITVIAVLLCVAMIGCAAPQAVQPAASPTAQETTETITIVGNIIKVTDDAEGTQLLIKADEGSASAFEEMLITVDGETRAEKDGEPADKAFAEGNHVSVYTNGMTTKSIPPRAVADLIVIG
ncbi:MAG: hypothetical protein RR292_06465 [Christensenellaceae bacterium]